LTSNTSNPKFIGPSGSNQFSIVVGLTSFFSISAHFVFVLFQNDLLSPLEPIYDISSGIENGGTSHTIL
jgi:hypothetical protein